MPRTYYGVWLKGEIAALALFDSQLQIAKRAFDYSRVSFQALSTKILLEYTCPLPDESIPAYSIHQLVASLHDPNISPEILGQICAIDPGNYQTPYTNDTLVFLSLTGNPTTFDALLPYFETYKKLPTIALEKFEIAQRLAGRNIINKGHYKLLEAMGQSGLATASKWEGITNLIAPTNCRPQKRDGRTIACCFKTKVKS